MASYFHMSTTDYSRTEESWGTDDLGLGVLNPLEFLKSFAREIKLNKKKQFTASDLVTSMVTNELVYNREAGVVISNLMLRREFILLVNPADGEVGRDDETQFIIFNNDILASIGHVSEKEKEKFIPKFNMSLGRRTISENDVCLLTS
eukprot:TRINITY_DN14035_c0_g1_i1.p1 TRINITY_DN14035_c0_g1~~TRINITY_DN14035_c0_g1_i1.p1  ORF type:complete len:148 (-),score=30.50 TRINITY_DN14035_c0_g1_i1:891-1334(-)